MSRRQTRTASQGVLLLSFASAFCLVACSDAATETEPPRVRPMMRVDADVTDPAQFFDTPYPSDMRLDEAGAPDLRGFPNPRDNPLVAGMRLIAAQRPGFAAIPTAYFRFDGAVELPHTSAAGSVEDDSPYWLLDLGAEVPARGRRIPVVSQLLEPDDYTPSDLLAIAPRPGFVLTPGRRYAFVVTDAMRDAGGGALGAAPGLAASGDLEPLYQVLDEQQIDHARVLAATVLTPGDVVAALAELSQAVRKAYTITIDGLALDPDDGADHARFCELHGSVEFPQFQKGTPPFATEGLFEMGGDGLPKLQRTESAPIVITLPKTPMPVAGYPLVIYFHGSGGLSTQVVDRGAVPEIGGVPKKGEGPSHVLAHHGFATAGSAHPVNPERLEGATDLAYLNFDNLPAYRDTFRQGVIEQRLYLDALLSLAIDPSVLSACAGVSLPAGETSYRLAAKPVFAMGQSMGGMYTNLIATVEPRIEAAVPTGAGGYWSYFLLETSLVPGKGLVPLALGSTQNLHYLHPALQLLQTAWEPAEPLVYIPRLGRRPLAGHAPKHVYEPIAKGDSYFPTSVFDAMVLAYGHGQAGDEIWPGTQEALALAGKSGFLPYPIGNNLSSTAGGQYTGVVVQYEGDGISDPHSIFAQLDSVKYQYGCFFELYRDTGEARVLAPAPLGTPCQ
jgi:hypothetical protein